MKFLTTAFLIITTVGLAFTQSLSFERTPDIEASFPGSMENFYKQVRLLITYPELARYKGIEGKCFIEFIVNQDGYIETKSIKTIKSLSPECDREAERVVSLITTKWLPATIGGKPVNSKIVLPISFVLLDDLPIGLPARTSIISKESKVASFGWDVYINSKMNSKAGRVLPGDSVLVLGWAPYLLLIAKDSIQGYVSYKSVRVTPELKELVEYIKKNSFNLTKAQEKIDSLTKLAQLNVWQAALKLNDTYSKNQVKIKGEADSIEFVKNPSVFFRTSVSKKTIYTGECAVLSLNFYVADDNKRPLQFYDLGTQLQEMTNKQLLQESAWTPIGKIMDIQGEQERFGSNIFTNYKIYSASYCPTKIQPIVFDPVSLRMLEFNPTNRKEKFMTPFTTKRIDVNVKPLPEGIRPTYSNGLPLVGKFMMSDSLISDSIYVGVPIQYKVTISGAGLLYPVEPGIFKNEGIRTKLVTTEYADTTINDSYYSRKTFIYQLIFENSGTYNLAEPLNYYAFDPEKKKTMKLNLSREVSVLPNPDFVPLPDSYFDDFSLKNKLIAIDASTSMMIEDYKPTRLEAVKTGLNNFLQVSRGCDLNLIVFGGNSIVLPSRKDSCYTNSMIKKIDHNLVTRGTAMGELIWLASQNSSNLVQDRILVIISDGDNTAGVLSPEAAISFAARGKLKIHTIGVGNPGVVPFGRDYFGKNNFVENTFTDTMLKKIANKTGGKYFWAKDASQVTDILKQIFPD